MAVSALRRLAFCFVSSAVLVAAGAAAAQDQQGGSAAPAGTPASPPPATPPAVKPAASESTTTELVITGSRIRGQTVYNSVSPVEIVTPDEDKAEGIIDPADALQHSALAAGSVQINNQFSGFVTNGGPGADTLSLRGLGSQRTLVLLNGRRLNPAGVSGTVAAVDLNVIPDAMVDHYEILKDGASSIYGSDAIGGVVNIITKDKYDGLTLESDNDLTQRGHGNSYELSATYGHVAENFHVTASLQYFRQDELTIGDLPNGKCPPENQFAPTVQGQNYGRSYANGAPYCQFEQVDDVSDDGPNTPGLFVFSGSAPASDPYIPFKQNTYPTYPRITNINTDTAEANVDAESPFQRFGATMIGGVDLPNNTEFYFEDLLTNRTSQQAAFLPQFFPADPTTIGMVSSSVFSPFHGDTVIPVIGAPVSHFTQDVWAGHAVFGFKGDFGTFLSGWKWDTYATYGFSTASYTTQFQDKPNLYNALDAVPAVPGMPANLVRTNPVDGLNYTCNIDLTNPGSGCYPLDWFESTAQFQTDPALKYIDKTETGHTNYEQVVVSGTADGPLFALPAGEVQGVIGAEFRYDALKDNPGPIAAAQDYFNLSTAGITQGNEDVGEVYLETEIPVIKGVPLIDLFSIDASGRFSDYKTAGTGLTYKIGANWQINSTLRVRGTYGTSFRGPALYENYLAAQTSFTSASDPCAMYGINASPTSNLYKNCASEGLSPTGNGFPSTPLVLTQGALGRLKPETSTNLVVGPVWQPTFADLQVGIDYYRIDVKNEISTIGPQNILDLCYDSAQFRSGSPYCTLISPRGSDGSIAQIDDSYLNVAEQIVSGVDFNLDYGYKFDVGQLHVHGEATYALEDNQELIPGTGFTNYVGSWGEPHFVGDVAITWRTHGWKFQWTTNYLGPQSEQSYTGDPTSRYKEYQQQQFYHSISLEYQGDKWRATAGIRDLFDSYPPVESFNPSPGYAPILDQYGNGTGNLQLLGRTFFFQLRKEF